MFIGYEVFTSTLGASEDSRCLSLQFEIEQSRFRDFSQAIELVDGAGGESGNRVLLAKQTVLSEILKDIKSTLDIDDTGAHQGETVVQ